MLHLLYVLNIKIEEIRMGNSKEKIKRRNQNLERKKKNEKEAINKLKTKRSNQTRNEKKKLSYSYHFILDVIFHLLCTDQR